MIHSHIPRFEAYCLITASREGDYLEVGGQSSAQRSGNLGHNNNCESKPSAFVESRWQTTLGVGNLGGRMFLDSSIKIMSYIQNI